MHLLNAQTNTVWRNGHWSGMQVTMKLTCIPEGHLRGVT